MPRPTPRSSAHHQSMQPSLARAKAQVSSCPYQLVHASSSEGGEVRGYFPSHSPLIQTPVVTPFGTQGKRGRKVALPTKKEKKKYLGCVGPNQGNEAKRAREGGNHRRPESERARESVKSE